MRYEDIIDQKAKNYRENIFQPIIIDKKYKDGVRRNRS